MICNDNILSRDKFAHRTRSSIRCSRQTQRTQLESKRERNYCEQQHLRSECYTINEEYITTDSTLSRTTEKSVQHEITDTNSLTLFRGPTQLRDSRRKTAEEWQSKKDVKAGVKKNYWEVKRSNQKGKIPSSNKSIMQILRNTMEYTEDNFHHRLKSIISSTNGMNYKNRDSEENFHQTETNAESKISHLQSSALREIQINTSGQKFNHVDESKQLLSNNKNGWDECHSPELNNAASIQKKMNFSRVAIRRGKMNGKSNKPNNGINVRQRVASFSDLQGEGVSVSVEAERRKKSASYIDPTQLEQFQSTGHGSCTIFSSSGSFFSSEEFCSSATDAVFRGLLKEGCCVQPSKSVSCASTTNHRECRDRIQFPSAKAKHHTAQPQLNDLDESVVMANGDETHRSSQGTDRSCTDVEKILRNDLYRKPFQQFLEQQFCAENINFYMAVEEYRSIPDTDLERRAKVACQIFERHFSPNCVEPVNIDNSTSKSIKDAVMSQNFTAQLYDVAQYQIFHLLKYDCWPRYLRAGGIAPTFDDGSNEASGTPRTSIPVPRQRREDKKRKSLIWHGLRPRFTRRKKAWSDGDDLLAQSCDHGSTLAHEEVEQSASPRLYKSQPNSRLSPAQDQTELTERAENTQDPFFVKYDTELKFATLRKYGSLKRRGFKISGKQRTPTETPQAHCGALPPQRTSTVTEVCTKFCTLMLNDDPRMEQIALRDPTESVGKWTTAIAAKRGMDPRATEVVDAQSGATIDPARQALDALNNRCVRLLPVLHFAAEILIPGASTKMGTCPTSRIVLLRARHGLSLSAVLRPILAKYLIDFDSCVIVLPSSFDAISGQTTVGSLGQRCIIVMTQQQFQERKHSLRREFAKELLSTQFSTPDLNLPFYQHGDVAFVELPTDFDLRSGKTNATRSYPNAKSEHTSGLLKFVRKASQAVTNREASDGAGPSSSSQQHHPPHQLLQSGGNNQSSSTPTDYADSTKFMRRKSLDTFQRMMSVAMTEVPYCGEDSAVENFNLAEIVRSPDLGRRVQEHVDGREKMFEIPDFLRKENTSEMRVLDNKLSLIDPNAPKIPSLYTSTVSSEKDFSPGERKKSLGWQRADYV